MMLIAKSYQFCTLCMQIGNTPLHYAQNNKNFEIVKILTEYGAVDDRINKVS